MSDVSTHITTTHSAVPPADAINQHLRKAQEHADGISVELSAAAAIDIRPYHARRLAALARAAERLDFAFAAIRRHQ